MHPLWVNSVSGDLKSVTPINDLQGGLAYVYGRHLENKIDMVIRQRLIVIRFLSIFSKLILN